MPTRSFDIGQVEAIVQDYYLPALRDQYFLSNALYYSLRAKGRVRTYNGGRAIFQGLSFAPEGGGGQWWAGVDKMDTRVRNPITGATFSRKNYSVPIVITRDEEDSVGTDGHKMIDLADAKMNIAKPTAVDAVGTELYNDGSDARRIGGLLLVTGANADVVTVDTSDTYGGISRTSSTNTWWAPQQYATATVTGGSSSFAGVRGFGPIGLMWQRIRRASGKSPTMIVSNCGTYQDYHDSLAGTGIYGGGGSQPMSGGQRYQPQDTALAKAGFENVMYRTAAWVQDERAPRTAAGKECVFMLNEETLNLVVHEKRNMSLDEWFKPYDQRVRLTYLDWSGELVCSERRANGVITNIDAALTA